MPVNLKVSREIALMEAGHNAAPPPRAGQVGLNHMARPIAGLEDLADLYNNLKEKESKINRAPDHGLSPGIYPTTAIASISISISGSTKELTSTSVLAG